MAHEYKVEMCQKMNYAIVRLLYKKPGNPIAKLHLE